MRDYTVLEKSRGFLELVEESSKEKLIEYIEVLNHAVLELTPYSEKWEWTVQAILYMEEKLDASATDDR